MAVRVRQISYVQQQPENPEQHSLNQQVSKRRKSVFTAKEKLLYIAFIVVVAVMAVSILHKQSSIHQTSIEIQQIESEITEIQKQNKELKVQVSELSTYERIWEKAKALGLTLNENNVKVVPGE